MLARFLLASALTAALAGPALAARPTKAVATITSGDVRAVVVARKTSGSLSPSASLTVVGYRRFGSTWKRMAAHPLGGGFFWKVAIHPHAFCTLRLDGSSLAISVLVTPSIGCDAVRTIALAS
jgi:hypothetical protein